MSVSEEQDELGSELLYAKNGEVGREFPKKVRAGGPWDGDVTELDGQGGRNAPPWVLF